MVIKNFLINICGFSSDWSISGFINDSVRQIREQVSNKKVLLALSGGVDSTVLAALLNKAIGRQLSCIFVDHGLLRKDEAAQVEAVCKNNFDINFVRIDAADRFLSKLAGVTDPEQKRKIVGEEFIRVFEDAAIELGKQQGLIEILAQGTIYPDVIESGGGGALVKSHHNVGGMPNNIRFTEVMEPFRLLFKNEVRQVGVELGLPPVIVWRQPFPGPGLAVRVLGEVTREKLAILREADAIFREELGNSGLSKDISQYFAVLTNIRSVGVTSDVRSYENVIALRAVNTVDFMSASFSLIPYDTLARVSARITTEVTSVSRVVYDITAKPPATIEWE
jgi:GMP synthase (glutamine-hydrolysing)